MTHGYVSVFYLLQMSAYLAGFERDRKPQVTSVKTFLCSSRKNPETKWHMTRYADVKDGMPTEDPEFDVVFGESEHTNAYFDKKLARFLKIAEGQFKKFDTNQCLLHTPKGEIVDVCA